MEFKKQILIEYMTEVDRIQKNFYKEYSNIKAEADSSFVTSSHSLSAADDENKENIKDLEAEKSKIEKIGSKAPTNSKQNILNELPVRPMVCTENLNLNNESEEIHSKEALKLQHHPVNIKDNKNKPEIAVCTVDETFLVDCTRIQDQTMLVNESAFMGPDGIFLRRKKARRKLGRKFSKRPFEPLILFMDTFKRIKTEQAPNYLIEYLIAKDKEELAKKRQEEEKIKLQEEHEKLILKEIEEKEKELMEYKKENEFFKSKFMELQKQIEELSKQKQNGKNQTPQPENEESDLLAQEIKIIEPKSSKMPSQAERLILNIGAEKIHKTEVNPPIPLECSILVEKNIKPVQKLNNFFKKLKNERLEKANKTILASKTNIEVFKGENTVQKQNISEKVAPIFNKTVHKPRQAAGAAISNAHNLYKQSIDFQAIQNDPKTYIPKCYIPFYSSEDEFDSGDKKFTPAPFTKDPELMDKVKLQVHSKIKNFFGNQKEIDVKSIFSSVENVSNDSPNKFRRNS